MAVSQFPINLPHGLTHLYVGANPATDAGLSALRAILAEQPALVAFDGTFLQADVDLGKTIVTAPTSCRCVSCREKNDSLANDSACSCIRLGNDVQPCRVLMQLYDSRGQRIRTAGVKRQLRLRAGCDVQHLHINDGSREVHHNCTYSTTFADDPRDEGAVVATILNDWVKSHGAVSLGFFDDDPFSDHIDSITTFNRLPNMGIGHEFYPGGYEAYKSISIQFLPLECDADAHETPDGSGTRCVCKNGYISENFRDHTGILIAQCRRHCPDYLIGDNCDVCPAGRYYSDAGHEVHTGWELIHDVCISGGRTR
eukprot:SAG31_NODE_8904_length_1366_cov_0.910813_2_plen_311_part_01